MASRLQPTVTPKGLSFSASRGIISQRRTYEGDDWVQTDAAVNPGNSGGALIDLETGRIVGVNANGFKNTEGLNFAVPMRPVCSIPRKRKIDRNPRQGTMTWVPGVAACGRTTRRSEARFRGGRGGSWRGRHAALGASMHRRHQQRRAGHH